MKFVRTKFVGAALSLLCVAAPSLQAAKSEPVVWYPKSPHGTPPVLVCLQGYRGYPGVVGKDWMQEVADNVNVAIVGFPATTDLGDDTQQWSEEPAADHAYIQYRLSALASTYKMDLSRVMLLGFSEGAMVAADVCTWFPEQYAGALVMSPGGIGMPKMPEQKRPEYRKLTFVLTCMAQESFGNVLLTRRYHERLTEIGCTVTEIEYPDVEAHSVPPDLRIKLPAWIREILHLPDKVG